MSENDDPRYGAGSGWQQPGTYGQTPYDVEPAQMYPPGYPPPYGYPGYGYPDPRVRNGAMAALITGCIAIVVCVNVFAIPTAILGGVALSRADTDPESARRLTKWAWISLGIGVGLVVLLIVAYFGLLIWIAASAATSTPY